MKKENFEMQSVDPEAASKSEAPSNPEGLESEAACSSTQPNANDMATDMDFSVASKTEAPSKSEAPLNPEGFEVAESYNSTQPNANGLSTTIDFSVDHAASSKSEASSNPEGIQNEPSCSSTQPNASSQSTPSNLDATRVQLQNLAKKKIIKGIIVMRKTLYDKLAYPMFDAEVKEPMLERLRCKDKKGMRLRKPKSKKAKKVRFAEGS